MIGPSGFMQAPVSRVAWCAKCDGPTECDDRGCVACAVLRSKYTGRKPARQYMATFARSRRARLKAQGVCINAISHGPPVEGKTKCARCIEVHKGSR